MADLPMIISVDDHVVEPANVWVDRLPKKYHEIGPRVVRAPMGEITFIGGKLTVKPGSEGVPTDWWYYEDLKRPLLRVDSAVGVPRDEVTIIPRAPLLKVFRKSAKLPEKVLRRQRRQERSSSQVAS